MDSALDGMEGGYEMGQYSHLQREDIAAVQTLMEEAFPPVERRTAADQAALWEDERYGVLGWKDDEGVLLAFLAHWRLEGFWFVEHIAVSSSLRNQGMGGRMMSRFLEECSLAGVPAVLEVEEPKNEMARRRIGFYQRLGFYAFEEYSYRQPPLQEGLPWIPLILMASGERGALLPEDLERELYTKVYKVL